MPNHPLRNEASPRRLRPMDPQLTSIQPGGGVVIRLEQAWGYVRRWYLSRFRSTYVKRMASKRKGSFNPCPHAVLDSRDLKFYRNQGGYYWEISDDPFQWRNRLPFARDGLAELFLLGGGFATLACVGLVCAYQADVMMAGILGLISLANAVIALMIVWFFRNPKRTIPHQAGYVVSPADGKIVEIQEIENDEFVGEKGVRIGIFLSVFNVHINRAPMSARVIGLVYQPGKKLNALRPESARENERLTVQLESTDGHRPMLVAQITGAFARRIVCWLRPGDVLGHGEPFGMIKLGSRTELTVPREPGLSICVRVGDKVKAGSSLLAIYGDSDSQPS